MCVVVNTEHTTNLLLPTEKTHRLIKRYVSYLPYTKMPEKPIKSS